MARIGSAVLCVLAGLSSARAAEFVLYQGEYQHTTSTKAFSFPPIAYQPSNWTSPVNYADGTAYWRYVVYNMANTNYRINYQWCLFQVSPNHTCCNYTLFTGPGTYTGSQVLKQMWSNYSVNWSGSFDQFMLVVKDANGAPVDDRYGFGGGWIGSPNFSLYYPFTVHVTVVIVSQGASFSGWSNYPVGNPPPQNQAPVASNSSASVRQGGSVQIALPYSDPDGPGPYTFTITQNPAHGALSGSGSTRTYTPQAGYSGSDSFKWKVNDGRADSNEATVSITVTPNQAPSVQNQTVTTSQNVAVAVRLSWSDPDGPGPYTITVTDSPDHGTLSGSGQDRTYTPGSGFSGTDSFSWKVNDGLTDSAVATVTIQVTPDSDGDGLGDSWEISHGLNPYAWDSDGDGVSDADEDPDGDGRTNLLEFQLGSDPYSPDGVSPGETGISCSAGGLAPTALAAAFGLALAWPRRLRQPRGRTR